MGGGGGVRSSAFPGRVIPVTLKNISTTGTSLATLSGGLRYRVSARTGWPGISTLLLCEMASLVSSFCLRTTTRITAKTDPSQRYKTRCRDVPKGPGTR